MLKQTGYAFMRSTALFALACMTLYATPLHADAAPPIPPKKPEAQRNAGIFDFSETFAHFTKKTAPSEAAPRPAKKPDHADAAPRNDNDLTQKDIKTYAAVFAAQDSGDFKQAESLVKTLDNRRLLGHVLYQRYMHPAYNSGFDELKNWLDRYNDHPGAQQIYTLAQRKNPKGSNASLKEPDVSNPIARRTEPTMARGLRYQSKRTRSEAQREQVKAIKDKIIALNRKNNPQAALDVLQNSQAQLDTVEYDIAQSRIAASFLYGGAPDKAYDLARQSVQRSGLHVPLAGWVAGLTCWMQKDYTQSAAFFETVGRSPYASAWTKAAGSYWAARAHMRMGNVKAVSTWLDRADIYPRTFYGMIATRALGRDFDFNWAMPTFTKDNRATLMKTPAGRRAIALVEIGQRQRAEAELLRMDLSAPKLRDAVLAYAGYARLPGLSMRLGGALSSPQKGSYYDAALYPVVPWQPSGGFAIDPALMHAIMRQESRFDASAASPSGAAGLMQLLPSTAQGVDTEKAADLLSPIANLELGQDYLKSLLETKTVDGDLLNVLMAYNAGPGNLAKWKKRWPDVNDPLLFIELIPSAETRAYVERVLANYWIYRLRDGKATVTLDAMTSGKRAQYALAAGKSPHATKLSSLQ
ncbi:MAG: lytic transglycosylase domain-containing protein [Bdellovibrionales bacterium]